MTTFVPIFRLIGCFFIACLGIKQVNAQYPTNCTGIGQRANSNGNANSCPNVNGTAYASNFSGTTYASVPTSAKTGNVQLTYTGANAGLLPYAITRVWLTSGGTTIQNVSFGPASPPVVSGGNTQVNYCFYGSNLPTAGTLSLEMTNPQTGVVWGICSYDASCNTNCVVTANPAALPVKFSYFSAFPEQDGFVSLKWGTAQEQNNKGFAVERSLKDGPFSQIGFVPSVHEGGSSELGSSYSYEDNQAPNGERVAYRLRQEDLDGNYTFSEVVVVNIPRTDNLPIIYVAGRSLNIQWTSIVGFTTCDIDVYDSWGRTLKRLHIARPGTSVVGSLPGHSIYYVAVRMANGQVRERKSLYVD